ncbi:MAG: hypothetical protein K0R24_1617 [Gammaproteobacteria bacterium]|nr:hypothetical protein [Gammaproteobacteria bacterium]
MKLKSNKKESFLLPSLLVGLLIGGSHIPAGWAQSTTAEANGFPMPIEASSAKPDKELLEEEENPSEMSESTPNSINDESLARLEPLSTVISPEPEETVPFSSNDNNEAASPVTRADLLSGDTVPYEPAEAQGADETEFNEAYFHEALARESQQVQLPPSHEKLTVNDTYSDEKTNWLSRSELNTLVFSVPIAHVFQPHLQQAVFSMAGDNNQSLAVEFADPTALQAQFVVSLKNGKVLSLHFSLDDVTGRILTIPSELSGTSSLSNEDNPFASNLTDNDYQERLLNFIKPVVLKGEPSSEWALVQQYTLDVSPNSDFSATDFKEWQRDELRLQRWQLCAKEKPVTVVASQFAESSNILAVTLSQESLEPNDCTPLIILRQSTIDETTESAEADFKMEVPYKMSEKDLK